MKHNTNTDMRLYHWSKADPDVFCGQVSVFEVQTEGKIWTVDDLTKKGATTTTRLQPKTLIVFAGEALDEFRRHPWWRITFWKTWFGQWWTKGIGDFEWNEEDTIRHGNVIIVTKIKRVPISNTYRLRKNYLFNIGTWFSIPLIFIIGLFFAWLFPNSSSYEVTIIEAGLFLFFGALILSKTKLDIKHSPSWEWEKELRQAELEYTNRKANNLHDMSSDKDEKPFSRQ